MTCVFGLGTGHSRTKHLVTAPKIQAARATATTTGSPQAIDSAYMNFYRHQVTGYVSADILRQAVIESTGSA